MLDAVKFPAPFDHVEARAERAILSETVSHQYVQYTLLLHFAKDGAEMTVPIMMSDAIKEVKGGKGSGNDNPRTDRRH